MDLTQIRYFLSLARTLNFTRAAPRHDRSVVPHDRCPARIGRVIAVAVAALFGAGLLVRPDMMTMA